MNIYKYIGSVPNFFDLTKNNEPIIEEGTANFNGLTINHLPPELHVMICGYLDSKSMLALRSTNRQLHKNIGKYQITNKIKTERKQKTLTDFLELCDVDKNCKPASAKAYTKFNTPQDRQNLEKFIVKVLGSETLTKYLAEKNNVFYWALKEHTINFKLPEKKYWHQHQQRQAFIHPQITWIQSLALEIIYSYHH